MKKFFGTFTLFLSLFYICWLLVMNVYPTYFKGIDYLSWDYKFNEVKIEEFNDATLILGDSTAEAGLNPTLLNTNEKVYNLSLPGGTIFESFVFLKRIFEKGLRPKRVFFIFSFHNYALNEGMVQRGLNYNVYSFDEIKSVIDWQRENGFLYQSLSQFDKTAQFFPFSALLDKKTASGMARMVWLEYLLSRLGLSFIDYNNFKNYLVGKESVPKEFIHSTKTSLKKNNGHVGYFNVPFDPDEYPIEVLQKKFKLHPFSKNYLEKSLILLKKNEVQTSILYFPLPQYYYNKSSDEFRSSFQEFYDELEKSYGVTVEKKMIWMEQELLIDGIHLNPNGVHQYSNQIKRSYF